MLSDTVSLEEQLHCKYRELLINVLCILDIRVKNTMLDYVLWTQKC